MNDLNMTDSKMEGESEPWYRAGKEDNFSIRDKILRTGCRDVNREIIECRNDSRKSKEVCERVGKDYNECMSIYKYLINSRS